MKSEIEANIECAIAHPAHLLPPPLSLVLPKPNWAEPFSYFVNVCSLRIKEQGVTLRGKVKRSFGIKLASHLILPSQ